MSFVAPATKLTCDELLSLVGSVGGGSRFRVLEDIESGGCASGAAGRPPRKIELRQVCPATNQRESCSRRQDDCARGAAARPWKTALRQESAS